MVLQRLLVIVGDFNKLFSIRNIGLKPVYLNVVMLRVGRRYEIMYLK